MTDLPPSLYEWAGGMPTLERLIRRFYEHVRDDPLLAPLFAEMDADHVRHVAMFIAEVFGGPKAYSERHGGHPHMVVRHMHRHLTNEQRKRWVQLLTDTADEVGLPDDPEFRSAFVAYLEWGSRLAVINAQPGAAVDPNTPMPSWDWGVPGGPYLG